MMIKCSQHVGTEIFTSLVNLLLLPLDNSTNSNADALIFFSS